MSAQAVKERGGWALPRAGRVWLLTAGLAAAAGGVLVLLPARAPFARVLTVPWWWLIPAFVFVYVFPVYVEFRRQATYSALDHIPLVVGMYFSSPRGLVLAAVLGSAGYALRGGQPAVKTVFNAANHAAAIAAGLAVFDAVAADEHRLTGALWLVALVALVVQHLFSLLMVIAVISVAGDRPPLKSALMTTAGELVLTLIAGSFAVIAAISMADDQRIGLLVAACLVASAVGLHSVNRVINHQQALGRLYTFARDIGPMVPDDGDLRPTLAEARELLRAERLQFALIESEQANTVFSVSEAFEGLEIHLADSADIPASARQLLASERLSTLEGPTAALWGTQRKAEDRMAARVGPAERPLGVLVAEQRSGSLRGFEPADLRLLEVVAGQLGAALEKGELLANLRRAATTDALTGLPNMHALRAHLDARLAGGSADHGLLVLLLDLDRFQDVNDTLGHDTGDALLVEVATRLAKATHDQGLCARVGGDKFAVVLPGGAGSEIARLAAMAVKNRVEGPVRLSGLAADVRVTIGMARAPEHGLDGQTLLRRAEMAASAGKGRSSGIAEWAPEHEQEGARRLQLLAALRQALATRQVSVAFQPKLRLGSGQVAGLEALARWWDPDLGNVSPLEFIPLAESSGLIGSLTTAILKAALEACRSWHERGIRVGVAVNLSARSLNDPIIVGQIAALLSAAGVDPGWLTLEITESSVMDNPTQTIAILRELRALGCRLSIDDFGTGYSSLTYVRGLPVHELKIDKSFVDNVTADPADRAVVRAVVELAHSLGLSTVAEGVERPEQAITLEGLNIDEVQGYFYARPMPPEETTDWLSVRMAHQ